MKINPVMKWPGGKRKLVPTIADHLPDIINTYIEPFLGGGAVFIGLKNNDLIKKSILNDINPSVMAVYLVISDSPQALINDLEELRAGYEEARSETQKRKYFELHKTLYNRLNAKHNYNILSGTTTKSNRIQSLSGSAHSNEIVRLASLFIFLNKTGFNGMYRVNKKGDYNIPFGKQFKPSFYVIENVKGLGEYLQTAELWCSGFETIINRATKNDMIYCDPPYTPLSTTSNFTGYASQPFNADTQKKLYESIKKAKACNANIMMSNSSSVLNKDIYKKTTEGFEKLYKLEVGRSVGSTAITRKKVKEIIATTYKPSKTTLPEIKKADWY